MLTRENNLNVSETTSFIKEENKQQHRQLKSREVKRPTVVGNPMFSSSSSESSGSLNQDLEEEPAAALDDLNLGMDYNQIMQYFDNLKESNA